MIFVTGATGAIGGRVAAALARGGESLRLFVRDPSRAPALPGVEIAAGSYEDVASLDAAMRGVTRAFVVSGMGEPVRRSNLHGNAIAAAARAGVEHLVYLSFQGASPASLFPYSVDHALSEAHVRASGVPFTILRDSLYADIVPDLFGDDGVVRGPAGDGRTAFVARDDVADVAARVLAAPAAYAGDTLDVTGPDALTYAEVAEIASAATGRALRYHDETLDEARASRAAFGAPAWEVEVWIGSYRAAAAGELAAVSDTVARVTGRAPLGLREYFARRPELLARLTRG